MPKMARISSQTLRSTLYVAVVMALVASGCEQENSGAAKAPNTEGPRAEVAAMLKERAAALNAGDVEGYLRPLSPEARAFEEPIARGVLSVPLAGIDLTLGDAVVSLDENAMHNAIVNFIYRYRDLPEDNPFRIELVTALVRENDTWRITVSERSGGPPLPPWATGPVEMARSPHLLALFRPHLGRVDEVLRLGEKAREALLSKLTLEPDPVHLLVLAETPAEFRELSGAPGGIGAATVDYQETVAHPIRPESRQMFIDVQAVLDKPAQRLEFEGREDFTAVEVFQHELGHLALSRFDRPTTPGWVAEGGAMYLSGEQRSQGWRSLVRENLLDRFSFVPLSDSPTLSPGLEYAYASAGSTYLIERFGVQQFWEFYRNFKDLSDQASEPSFGSKGARRILRRWFKIDLEDLDVHTRDWIRRAVG
ncbi:MAG: hypothetical protein ABR540_13505 [Acidimicrobiales bacterium]|nr:hypothetical protein [Chloroflexota bacterium]